VWFGSEKDKSKNYKATIEGQKAGTKVTFPSGGLKVTPEITGAPLYSGPSSLLQAARQHAATAMISNFFIL